MAPKPTKPLRCAIYTRKSTEHGLELEFNSLHAQREACEAYIKSQASIGWKLLPGRYDDPAYSGGNMERPALQELLKDINAGSVDVVVVYKIDRLTRALSDFAKLVELFDKKSVSFVAVTQQFNTTTSMGRLTLNVLLSFAQFERELSSERVRDKIAASRKKGKWTGGTVPLGYDSIGKKLVINKTEANTVRMIFSRYLALKSFQAVITELDKKGIVTKARIADGKTIGCIPFTYGPLAYLLKNRTYLGETGHNGSWFEGEHEPVVDKTTFNRVQELLRSNSIDRRRKRTDNEALLEGVLFDDRGNRMTPSYSCKNGVRYRFYVSRAHLKGRKADAGSISRIAAQDIEAAVLKSLRERIGEIPNEPPTTAKQLVERHVSRVEMSEESIVIKLKPDIAKDASDILVPRMAVKTRNTTRSECHNDLTASVANLPLIQAIVRAHAWVRWLAEERYDSIETLAKAVQVHPKVVRNAIRMAFLAPDITTSILDGSQHSKLMLQHFNKTIPLNWTEQRGMFVDSA